MNEVKHILDVISGRKDMLVYISMDGRALSTPANGVRAKRIFEDNDPYVVGVYNKSFFDVIEGNPEDVMKDDIDFLRFNMDRGACDSLCTDSPLF